MPQETNILSLTFNFTVQEVEASDEAGNFTTEEWYTISCGDSVCWREKTEKKAGGQEAAFVGLQVEHILKHLRDGLEQRAKRIGEESLFAAAKQLPHAAPVEWKKKGMDFFERRGQFYQDRARTILSIRRGRPRKVEKVEMARLPERYNELREKFKEVKRRHNSEQKRVERERKRGLGDEEWRKEWLRIARSHYPKERHEYLEMIADRDKYTSSPSNVALFALAHETGYEPKYLEKLLTAARKAAKTEKPDIIPRE